MKLPPQSSRERERGVAVIIVLALIGIIMLYLAANQHCLVGLKHQLRLTEQHQIKRLAAPPAATIASNTPAMQP